MPIINQVHYGCKQIDTICINVVDLYLQANEHVHGDTHTKNCSVSEYSIDLVSSSTLLPADLVLRRAYDGSSLGALMK